MTTIPLHKLCIGSNITPVSKHDLHIFEPSLWHGAFGFGRQSLQKQNLAEKSQGLVPCSSEGIGGFPQWSFLFYHEKSMAFQPSLWHKKWGCCHTMVSLPSNIYIDGDLGCFTPMGFRCKKKKKNTCPEVQSHDSNGGGLPTIFVDHLFLDLERIAKSNKE